MSPDAHVQRHTCGTWTITGRPCTTCEPTTPMTPP